MWTPLIFLAFAGIVIGQSPWKANQEYVYDIHSRTLTSLPDLMNRHVGIITRGKLILQMESEDVIIGKLVNMVHAHFHDNMEKDWNLESAEKDMNFQETDLNNRSFLMHLEQGMIRSVAVDSSFTNDQVNQLKAILSQLQVVANDKYLIKRQYNQMPETNKNPHGMYAVMEPTITGNCETLYDIEPVALHSIENVYAKWVFERSTLDRIQPKPDEELFQIVKTMNYSNCYVSSGYHFGINGESDFKSNTNQMGDFFSKSSVTRILAKGNWKNFRIQNAYTTNRVLVSPTMYQDQQAEVRSQIQLTLSKNQPISQRLERPSETVNAGDLVYRYNRPSDKDNKVAEINEEHLDMASMRNRRSIEDQQRQNMKNQISSSNNKRNQRPSWYNRVLSASSSSSSSSSSSEENESTMRSNLYYQPMPNMEDAPEIPLHHYTVGNQGRSIQLDANIDVEKEAVQLAREISEDLRNQNEIPKRNTLQKFDILRDLMQTMNLKQIESIRQQLGSSNEANSQSLARKVFNDAVAAAGTGPAVSAVLNWISQREIQGIEAQNLLEDVIRNVHIPTVQMMEAIFEFLKSEQVMQEKELFSVGVMTFTNLLRRAHVDKRSAFNRYPVHVFESSNREVEQFVSEKVISYLASRLHQSVERKNSRDILLYLRAIGNLGDRNIVRVYEDYLEDNTKLTSFQRTAMVLSLDKLARIHPRLARNILFKIYANVADKPETRSIAVLLLMHADPTVAMLQRMAEMTHDDPSEAVQSLVKSVIESAAELKDSKHARLASKARNVRNLLNPRAFGHEYSKTYFRDYVANEMNLIYAHQLTNIIGNDNIIPKGILYEAYKNYGGVQTKTTEFQAMVSSVEELMKLLPNDKYETHDHGNNYSNDNSKWSTHQIAKDLNIEPEMLKELEGHILFKILGRKRFFSFDEKTLRELPKILVSEYELLKQAESLQYNKMYTRKEVVVAFPLATGYPFIYTFTMPTLLQAIGSVKVKTTPNVAQNPTWDTIRSLQSLNVSAKVHLVFSSDQIGKVGFITPFDRQRYVAGHVRKSYVHVPLNVKVDFDIKHKKVSGKFAPIDFNKDFNMIESSSWPFTLRKDVFDLRPAAEAKDIKLINSRQPHVENRILGEKSTGMAFKTYLEHHYPENTRTQMSKTLWNQGMYSLAKIPLSCKNLMGKILSNQDTSFWSYLPYSSQPSNNANSADLLMSLTSLPYWSELSMDEIVKVQGLLSLINLPFADIDTLQETARHSGILKSGSLPWPLETLDQYIYNVKYDASHSANQVVKFSVSFDRIYNSDKTFFMASKRMQGPSSFDEKKLAIPVNVLPDSDERRQQFLENAAHGIKQATSAVLDMSLVFDGNKKTEYIFTMSGAHSPVDEKNRVLIFLGAKPIKSTSTQQISLSLTGKYPKKSILNFDDALNNNEKSNVKAHIHIGENVQTTPTYMNVKLNMEQTEDYKQYLLNDNSDGRRCKQQISAGNHQTPSCLDAINWVNLHDYVTVSTEVENSNQEIQNGVRAILRAMQHIGFWNLEQDKSVKTKPNHFETTLKFTPTMNSVNLTIVTEDMKQTFRDLPIDRSLQLFLANHDIQSERQEIKREDRHICALDKNVITTFDRNVLSNKIGKCWHAMVQTRINQEDSNGLGAKEISLLVRSNENPQLVDMTVVVAQEAGQDHVIRLIAGNSKVQVNGQEEKLSTDESVDVYDKNNQKEAAVRVYQRVRGEYAVQVGRNLMNIDYNGKEIRIHMNPSYRGNTNGLCGTFTGEKFDDLITPKKCVVKNERLFAASWALADESCSNEIKEIKAQVDKMPCNKLQYSSGKFVTKMETESRRSHSSAASSSSSSSSEETYKKNEGNIHRNDERNRPVSCNVKEQMQFIEIDDKICFTMDALPACPSHCTAQKKQERKTSVHCRNIHDSVAQLYKQKILNGANPDISARPVSRTVSFNVPTKCTYLN